MRLPFKGTRTSVPPEVTRAIGLARGERVLATADTDDGGVVALTTHRFAVLDTAHQVALARPWHAVDGAFWDQDSETLRVTWVADPETSLRLRAGRDFHGVLRERVQASVVLEQFVEFGPRRRARAAIRKDVATGDLIEQVIVGRGVSFADPGVREACEQALTSLREEIGLDQVRFRDPS